MQIVNKFLIDLRLMNIGLVPTTVSLFRLRLKKSSSGLSQHRLSVTSRELVEGEVWFDGTSNTGSDHLVLRGCSC